MPRHPPYTLSSLTTFIDHRLPQGLRMTVPAILARHGSTTDQITEKVLNDTWPRKDNKTEPIRARHRGTFSNYLEPRLFTCQRAALSITSRQSFPPNAGESAASTQTGGLIHVRQFTSPQILILRFRHRLAASDPGRLTGDQFGVSSKIWLLIKPVYLVS